MPSRATSNRNKRKFRLGNFFKDRPELKPRVRVNTGLRGLVGPMRYDSIVDIVTPAGTRPPAASDHEQSQSINFEAQDGQPNGMHDMSTDGDDDTSHFEIDLRQEDDGTGHSLDANSTSQAPVPTNIAPSPPICLHEPTVGLYLKNLDIAKGLPELLRICRSHRGPNNMIDDFLHWFREQQIDLVSTVSHRALPESSRLPIDYRGVQKLLQMNSVFHADLYCLCKLCETWKPRSMFDKPFTVRCCSKKPSDYDSHFIVYQIHEILQLLLPFFMPKVKPGYYRGCSRLEAMREKVNGTENDVYLSLGYDGVPFSPSSGISVYPILATIDGLSGKHTKSSTFIIGVWMGSLADSKPPVRTVFAPVISQLNELAVTPMTWVDQDGSIRKSRVFLTTVLTDTVGRPQVMCLTQFNGLYGCAWCLQQQDKKKFWDYKPRRQHGQPRTNDDLRTVLDEYYTNDGDELSQDLPGLGIQGRTPLSDLPYFDIVKDFPPCTMHANYEGVAKLLLHKWTIKFKYLLPRDVRSIDDFLTSCKPPSRITRPPRVLKKLKKAHELCVWLFYTGPVVLQNHLPGPVFQHFLHLVRGLSLLHKSKPTAADIASADTELNRFLQHYSRHYEEGNRAYNIHILQHLCEFVKDRGPLQQYSLMPMESYNKHIKELPTGPKYVTLQMCTRFLEETILKAKENSSPKHFVQEFHGFGEEDIDSWPNDRIKAHLSNHFSEQLTYFPRVKFGKKVFHSLSYKATTRTNSSCYLIRKATFFDVYMFLETPAGFVALGEELQGSPYNKTWYLFQCKPSKVITALPVGALGEVVFKMDYDDCVYVAQFINNFESYSE